MCVSPVLTSKIMNPELQTSEFDLYYPGQYLTISAPFVQTPCYRTTMIPQSRIYLPYYSEGFNYFRPCGQPCCPFVPQWQQQSPVTCPPAGFTTGRAADYGPVYTKVVYPSHVRPSVSSLAVMMNPVHQQLFTAPLIRKERKQIIIKDPTQGGRDITNEIMTGRWTTSQVIIKDPTQGGRDITTDIMSGEWTTPTETSPHSVDAEVQTNSDPVKPAAVLRGLLESVEDPAAPTETESSAASENPGSDEAVSKHHDDVQKADKHSEKIKSKEVHCGQNKQQQRKKYSRDFLLDLQLTQLSLQRPKVLQHIPEVVLDQPLLQNLYLRDQMREVKPSVTNQDRTVPEPVNVQEEKISEKNVALKSDHCDQNKQQQRKKYSRDFLLDLQLTQLSLQRPKVLQHVPEVVLDQPLVQNLYLRDQMREVKPSVTNLDSTVPEPVNVQEEKIIEENVALKSDHCDQNKQQQRKKYSRDFLLDLQLNQLSLQRPKVLQHVPEVVLDQPLLQNLYLRDQMREVKPSVTHLDRTVPEPVNVQEEKIIEENVALKSVHCDQNKHQQRKKYSRDFLLDLKLNQLSLQRPKVLQHVPEVVLDQPLLQNLYLRDQMREVKPSVTSLDSTVPEPVNVQEEKISEENVAFKLVHCDQNKQQQRKKYSRDFLLDLQLNQLSLQRPKVLQHVPEVVLDQPLLQNLYLRDQMREVKPSVTNLDSTVPEPVNVQEEKISEENVALKSVHCDQNKQQQRKKYSRDFLLDLQLTQLSLQRPKVLQHVPEVVLDQPLMQNLYLRDQMREVKPSLDNMERPPSEPADDHKKKMDMENISKHAGSNKLPQRIKYDREFLLNLQMTSASLQRPKVMLDIKDIVLDKTLQQQLFLRDQMISGKSFSPLIANQGCQKKEGERELPSRMHHLQRDQHRDQRKVINISMNNDVQLHKAEKAWKPAIKKSCKQEKDQEATETQELFQKVCSILNKMTPEKFQQLMKQLTELPINTEERLKGVIELIFKKAVAEPNFSTVYARMCSGLMELKVPTSDYSGSTLDFINLLVGHCEEEFEKQKDNKLLQKKLKYLDEAKKEKEQQILKEELEEIKIKARLCSLGNIKFMGELYKQKMLTDQFIYRCITKLLENNNEESLESLCKLLSTAGKDLDLDNKNALLDNYFNQLWKIIKKRRTSSRIRFMIQDVLDLRRNNWVPRRSDQGPKTIKEVHKDAEVEDNVEQFKVQQKLLLQQSKVQAQNKSWNTKPVYNKKTPNDGSHQGKMPKPCASNYFDVTTGQMYSPRSRTNSRRSEDVRSHTHFSVKQGKQSCNGDRQFVSDKVKMRKYASQGSTESAVVKREPTPAPKAALSKEQLEKKSVAIIEEYLHINDLKEALQCVEEMNSASLLFIFVRIGVEMTLERSTTDRGHLGLLFHHLIRDQILPAEQYFKGFQEILEVAEDMAVDIPHIWLYLAEIITPVLQYKGIPMAQLFRAVAKPLLPMEKAATLLVQIINQLSKKMSYKEARALWDEAGLSWKDFLPEGDDENTFVMEQLPPEWTTM